MHCMLPTEAVFATTFHDIRGRLAGLRPSHSTVGHRDSSALPWESGAQRGSCRRANNTTHRRSTSGTIHPGRHLDSHCGCADRSRRALDRLGRRRQCLDANHPRGPERHAGNDWTRCVVDRFSLVREETFPRTLTRHLAAQWNRSGSTRYRVAWNHAVIP